MKIFDAHVHLPIKDIWNLKNFDDKKKHLLAELKKYGVSGAIVIADSEPPGDIGYTEDLVTLFAKNKNIFVMGALSPLIDLENNILKMEKYLEQKEIIAIKIFPGHESYYLNDPRLIPIIQLCKKFDVPLAIHSGWDNPQYSATRYIIEIAKAHPSLRIVICHMHYPRIDLCYAITKKYKNIYYDISSLASEKHLTKQFLSTLNLAVKTCPGRIIFGSDYGDCSIADHIELINSLDTTEIRKQRIFFFNALRLYKIRTKRNCPIKKY